MGTIVTALFIFYSHKDNVKQTFNRDETSGFFSEFFDELGVINVSTEEVVSPEIQEFIGNSDTIDQSIKNAVAQIDVTTTKETPDSETFTPSGSGPSGSVPSGGIDVPDEAYNAIGQLGPRGQSNEGYEYKFEQPPGQGLNPGVTKIGDPDPEPKAQVEGEGFKEIYITIYKDGEERQILESDFNLYSQAGWSRTRPSDATGDGIEGEVITDEVGPGQVVNDQLNTFNNIPQNAILIEAAGQLFL